MDFILVKRLGAPWFWDVFGIKQSGIPEFKIADLIRDYDILEQARKDAIFMPRKIQQEKKPRQNA